MNRARSPHRSVSLLAAAFLPLLALVGLAAPALGAAPTTPPSITAFTPIQGPVGSTVVLDGSNFRFPLGVTFTGNVRGATQVTFSRITVTVPDGAQTGPLKVTTPGGSTTTAVNFTVGPALPVLTLTAPVPQVAPASGATGLYTLSLSAPAATDLVVSYYVAGTAAPGTDYAPLKGTAKIKAGRTSKSIRVVPEGSLGGAAKKVVKLTLRPGTGYTLGTSTPVKVKIVAGE